jgi:hypothetical protein
MEEGGVWAFDNTVVPYTTISISCRVALGIHVMLILSNELNL